MNPIYLYLIASACMAFGYMVGAVFNKRTSFEDGYAKGLSQGWVDRGIEEWRKDQAKRDNLGRFKALKRAP